MKTLVSCVHHPSFFNKDGMFGFREPVEVAKAVVNAELGEVL